MALQNIGSVHLSAGRLEAAREALAQAIEVNPSWAAAWNGLGAVEIQGGNRQAAIAAWRRAVELDPSNFDALSTSRPSWSTTASSPPHGRI